MKCIPWTVIAAAFTFLLTPRTLADPATGKNLLPPVTQFVAQPNGLTDTSPRWQFSLFGPAQGTAAADGTALKFHVTQGAAPVWYAQVKYLAHVTPGTTYELRCRAKADVPVTLVDYSERFKADYTPAHQELRLTSDWKTFAWRFVAHEAVDDQDVLPEYFCGLQPGNVWVGDVSLTALPPGAGLTLPITDTSAWLMSQWGRNAAGQEQEGLGQQITMTPEGGTARLAAGDGPPYWTAWESHVPLQGNTAYTLRFRARADAPRRMAVTGEQDKSGTPPNGLDQSVDLTADWQPYTLTFTTKAGTTGVHMVPEFIISGPTGTVWLSDVSLTEASAVASSATTPAPPPYSPPTEWNGPAPLAGETQLSGMVQAVAPGAQSLRLEVFSVTQPGGSAVMLDPPRLKTILLHPQALTVTSPAGSRTAADLAPGATVSVNGRDGGPGKPLTGREIAVQVPGARPAPDKPVVGVYYFGGWADRSAGNNHLRKPADTNLLDHHPELQPLTGWYDDTPAVLEQEAAWAHSAGVSFFIFDWYDMARVAPTVAPSAGLNAATNLFQKLPDKQGVQFALMYTNHDVWNIPHDQWPEHCRQWVHDYFLDPAYYKIDGKPVFLVYSLPQMKQEWANPRDAWDVLRAAARAAGLPGVFLVGVVNAPGDRTDDGYDAFTGYNYLAAGTRPGPNPYSMLVKSGNAIWDSFAAAGGTPYIPVVTSNDDRRPWKVFDFWFDRTPPEFRDFVVQAVQWSRRHPEMRVLGSTPLIIVEAWNELGEGSYILPTQGSGFAYMDALRAALDANP